MAINKRYNLIVYSDGAAAPRRMTLSYRILRGAAVSAGFLALAFAYFAWHYSKTYDVRSITDSLEADKRALADENERYVAKINSIIENQKAIEERISKLATMVGVESLGDTLTMGGTGGVTTAELAFSAPGLPAESARKIVGIESQQSFAGHNLDELENIYREKQLLLNFVPSIWPVEGLITTHYGWRNDPFTGQPEFHAALDISARTNTPIKAPADGVVTSLGYNAGYGNTLVLSHGYGYVTRFAHLHAFNTKLGAKIQRGDVIGYVGTTGRSTGPHLHYEILVNNKAVNARNFVLDEQRRF